MSDQTPEERMLEKTLRTICEADVLMLNIKNREYGGSWKKRGGTGAFMMLARKWDRLEEQVRKLQWDVFTAALNDERKEGVLDDIGDLRRYLLLVESEVMNLRALAADPWTAMATVTIHESPLLRDGEGVLTAHATEEAWRKKYSDPSKPDGEQP